MFRRLISLTTLASLMLALGLIAPTPAMADPNPVSWTVDKTSAAPGDTVTITATFTNLQAVDATFAYMSIYPTWETQIGAAYWEFTGCTGEISWCSLFGQYHLSAGWHPTAPLAPGAARTVTLTYQVLPPSSCYSSIAFRFYAYHEYTGGPSDTYSAGPITYIDC